MTKATQYVFWPGKEIAACDKHAAKARLVAHAMGFEVSSRPMPEGVTVVCINCLNEEADKKDK